MPFGETVQRSRPVRVAILIGLIAGGVLLTRLVETQRVKPLFLPTPTSTRTALSYQEEAEAHFSSGDLVKAIAAYQQAVSLAPGEALLWAKLARIQTYSSALTATPEEEWQRLQAAKASIDRAIELDDQDGFAWAIRILVYDWLASAIESVPERQAERQDYVRVAEEAYNRAQFAEGSDTLALAFDAELQVDQQNYAQAEDEIGQALDSGGADMDVLRVHGIVLESTGHYQEAIEAYQQALTLAPNFTFLHLRIGANHRRLGHIEQALESFRKAALINAQLGVKDPIPHLAIGRTYLQDGEFITAARNVEAAVSLDPSSPQLLGFLGIAYFKARNYENAEDALRCAVNGCDVETQAWLLCTRLRVLDCTEADLSEVEAQAIGLDVSAAVQLYARLLCRGQGYTDEECDLHSLQDLSAGVSGLSLQDQTQEYYYTFGTVLAFAGECVDAGQIFDQLEQSYSTDSIIMDIVTDGRQRCLSPETG